MVTVCVDAMGGDEPPEVVLEGIAAALDADQDIRVLVAGPAELVEPFCADKERATPLVCTEVIGMDEHPANAVHQKRDSTIVRGCEAVHQGEADAFFSAGSTGAVFAAALYEACGYPCFPGSAEDRHDSIEAVTLGSAERVVSFCRGIQAAAPVDAHVTPEPWDMPGYEDPVVMAAGAFVSGASIELSADAPIREPYNVYFQGGLTWPSAKLGILMSLACLYNDGLVRLPVCGL